MEDIITIMRVYTFTGPRSKVEKQIQGSVHGERDNGNGVLIRAATLGLFPDILMPGPVVPNEEE